MTEIDSSLVESCPSTGVCEPPRVPLTASYILRLRKSRHFRSCTTELFLGRDSVPTYQPPSIKRFSSWRQYRAFSLLDGLRSRSPSRASIGPAPSLGIWPNLSKTLQRCQPDDKCHTLRNSVQSRSVMAFPKSEEVTSALSVPVGSRSVCNFFKWCKSGFVNRNSVMRTRS